MALGIQGGPDGAPIRLRPAIVSLRVLRPSLDPQNRTSIAARLPLHGSFHQVIVAFHEHAEK
jgi:hypothetical protein